MPYNKENIEGAKAARLRYYHKNKKAYIDRALAKKKELRDYVIQFKQGKPCLDCGENFEHYLMDFDHRDASSKIDNINKIVRLCSWAKLKAEMEKCDLVCCMCHRKRTWKRQQESASI